MESCEELRPKRLSSVTSIGDSEDLPLGIYREALRLDKTLKVIHKNLVKKLIDLFSERAQNKEGYNKYYKAFSNNFITGNNKDSRNSEKIAKVLSFYSNKSGDEMTTLKDYVMGMKKSWNGIYYITDESKKAVKNLPFLEKLEKKGYEVHYMNAIGEYIFYHLKDYEGNKLLFATKEGLKFDESGDKKKTKKSRKRSWRFFAR